MTIIQKLESIFRNNLTGLVTLSILEEVTKNHLLIIDVGKRFGFYPYYKPRSKKLVGYSTKSYEFNNREVTLK